VAALWRAGGHKVKLLSQAEVARVKGMRLARYHEAKMLQNNRWGIIRHNKQKQHQPPTPTPDWA
jgi:hypothetical protein